MNKNHALIFREIQNNDRRMALVKSILIAIFGCLSIISYGQLNIRIINKKDKWIEIDTNQRRLYVSAISEEESIVSVKNRMKADDFKNMMIYEQRDSSLLWIYFKTDSSLAIANTIEQFFLGHGIESCQDATLYGYQNNQTTETFVYQDKRLRYFKLLPLKTVNKEAKEWLLKLVVPPFSNPWRSGVYIYFERKSNAEEKDYSYLIYQIPLIALIIILIFYLSMCPIFFFIVFIYLHLYLFISLFLYFLCFFSGF